MPPAVLLGALLLALCTPAAAQEPDLWQVGARLGFDDGRNDEDFYQTEAFVARLFPVSASAGSLIAFAATLEASAGMLNGGSDTGALVSAGPGARLGFWSGRLQLKAGVSPTVISRDDYGDEDLGGPLQFTSHFGLSVGLSDEIHLGYRFQHMSNAGLYHRNPGLNLHMAEIFWRF